MGDFNKVNHTCEIPVKQGHRYPRLLLHHCKGCIQSHPTCSIDLITAWFILFQPTNENLKQLSQVQSGADWGIVPGYYIILHQQCRWLVPEVHPVSPEVSGSRLGAEGRYCDEYQTTDHSIYSFFSIKSTNIQKPDWTKSTLSTFNVIKKVIRSQVITFSSFLNY